VLEAGTAVLDVVSAAPVLDLSIQAQGRARRAPIVVVGDGDYKEGETVASVTGMRG
jgi:hypothetical protein